VRPAALSFTISQNKGGPLFSFPKKSEDTKEQGGKVGKIMIVSATFLSLMSTLTYERNG
jgi:hypothetical protein